LQVHDVAQADEQYATESLGEDICKHICRSNMLRRIHTARNEVTQVQSTQDANAPLDAAVNAAVELCICI
jgi:hypothetical protein